MNKIEYIEKLFKKRESIKKFLESVEKELYSALNGNKGHLKVGRPCGKKYKMSLRGRRNIREGMRRYWESQKANQGSLEQK